MSCGARLRLRTVVFELAVPLLGRIRCEGAALVVSERTQLSRKLLDECAKPRDWM